MTIALPAEETRRPVRFDLTWPVILLFAALLCVLILLPMSWLLYYAFGDRSGAFTLNNFVELCTSLVFTRPPIPTFIIATSFLFFCSGAAAPMGWLVARTDMPLRRTVRALV